MNNWWGIDLNPLILEIRKLSLTQQAIIALLQTNNNSQTLTKSLLQEQNKLLQKLLDKK